MLPPISANHAVVTLEQHMCIDSLKYLYSISQTTPPSWIRDKAISSVIPTTQSHFARPWSTQAPPFPPTYSASSEARETQGPPRRVCTCPRGGPDRGLLHAQLFRPQATNSFQHEETKCRKVRYQSPGDKLCPG